MKNKVFFVYLFLIAFVSLAIAMIVVSVFGRNSGALQTEIASVAPLLSSIVAEGSVHSQNEATLNFQTGGRLVYLPFKEGDSVSTGTTIAQLDTYALQRQLSSALNTYRSTRDTFDQTAQNVQNNNLQGQLVPSFTNAKMDKTDAINDGAKRILDQNQANLDNSVVNVELANYAMQLATLTSPISGIITHEDVSVTNINVSPATTFTVADPNTPVFRANIPVNQIAFVSEGSPATIRLDTLKIPIKATVSKIYPQKITLANGQEVYQVDVVSDNLATEAKLGETGSVLIQNGTTDSSTLVPAWTVLSHSSVWVLHNGTPLLHKINVGKTANGFTSVMGLSKTDKVIIDPEGLANTIYHLL
jgi:RND family efflux transporter MFP subunit